RGLRRGEGSEPDIAIWWAEPAPSFRRGRLVNDPLPEVIIDAPVCHGSPDSVRVTPRKLVDTPDFLGGLPSYDFGVLNHRYLFLK
ncbi:MAG: hypothetical protein ACRCT7_01550, partial [Shewanella sp.]